MKKKQLITFAVVALVTFTGCGSTAGNTAAYTANSDVWMESSDYAADSSAFTEDANYVAEVAVGSDYGYDDFSYEEDFQREGYHDIEESGFVSVKTQPFSTFGADIDTATYANLRRTVTQGYGIDPSAVRIEELINYFDYDYAKPENGDKFGVVTTLTPCPWNEDTELLRIGIKAEEIAPAGGSNIVFLIDTSGSMFDDDKLPLAQKAFKLLAKQLTEEDVISIVTYAGGDEVILEGARGNQTGTICDAIDRLEAWGSTNGEGGINRAYEIAEKYYINGGNNRVILATDGDLNVGISSEAGLTDLIEEKKESGVMLSCLGFGTGNYMDDKMEALADHGNGNYSYIDCEAEAEKVLKDELWSTLYTVAKDVKLQVEFNPENVKGYRLIGYENRKMAAEDFADDTKDGGEVGSGQTVTVLYELVTADSDYDIPEVSSRYGTQAVSKAAEDTAPAEAAKDELLVLNIRYKEPDAVESILREYPITAEMFTEEMDSDTSFAAGVAQIGMLIRGSDYAGNSTYENVYERLKDIQNITDDDYRLEFLTLIKKCEKHFG